MFIALSNSDPAPLYEQIKKQITEQITNGKLLPGSMLPSIRLLSKELGISVITVKKAYEDLEAVGYFTTQAGKGSFVAEAGLEFIKETQLKEVEQHFEAGISQCKSLRMTDNEILKVFKVVLEEKP